MAFGCERGELVPHAALHGGNEAEHPGPYRKRQHQDGCGGGVFRERGSSGGEDDDEKRVKDEAEANKKFAYDGSGAASNNRAKSSASLRSVLTRSDGPRGVLPGAMTCIPTPAAIAAR